MDYFPCTLYTKRILRGWERRWKQDPKLGFDFVLPSAEYPDAGPPSSRFPKSSTLSDYDYNRRILGWLPAGGIVQSANSEPSLDGFGDSNDSYGQPRQRRMRTKKVPVRDDETKDLAITESTPFPPAPRRPAFGGGTKENVDQTRFERMTTRPEDTRDDRRSRERAYGRSSVQSKTAWRGRPWWISLSKHPGEPSTQPSPTCSFFSILEALLRRRCFRTPVPRVYRTAGISAARYVRADRVITRRS